MQLAAVVAILLSAGVVLADVWSADRPVRTPAPAREVTRAVIEALAPLRPETRTLFDVLEHGEPDPGLPPDLQKSAALSLLFITLLVAGALAGAIYLGTRALTG